MQTRGLPSLPAVPSLGLPDMPQIALPATAEGLVTPLPAPKPQVITCLGCHIVTLSFALGARLYRISMCCVKAAP